MQWHQDQYKLVVSLKPAHLVRRLSVEVTVSERMGIGYVHIPHLRTSCVHSNTHTGMWAHHRSTVRLVFLE